MEKAQVKRAPDYEEPPLLIALLGRLVATPSAGRLFAVSERYRASLTHADGGSHLHYLAFLRVERWSTAYFTGSVVIVSQFQIFSSGP